MVLDQELPLNKLERRANLEKRGCICEVFVRAYQLLLQIVSNNLELRITANRQELLQDLYNITLGSLAVIQSRSRSSRVLAYLYSRSSLHSSELLVAWQWPMGGLHLCIFHFPLPQFTNGASEYKHGSNVIL